MQFESMNEIEQSLITQKHAELKDTVHPHQLD